MRCELTSTLIDKETHKLFQTSHGLSCLLPRISYRNNFYPLVNEPGFGNTEMLKGVSIGLLDFSEKVGALEL